MDDAWPFDDAPQHRRPIPAGLPTKPRGITYHPEVEQGSETWLSLRCGLLTASEMKLILTPTLKIAKNEKTRAHVWEIAAQRITGYTEPHYISDDMLRGHADECYARDLYAEHYAPVTKTGFVTRDDWGFTIGYSPDGLVGDDGLIEAKSRRQKFQIETIARDRMPDDFLIQVQTGLLVTDRKWLDFISYSGGLPMFVGRVVPDPEVQEAIITAAAEFEAEVAERLVEYRASEGKYPMTERRVEQELIL